MIRKIVVLRSQQGVDEIAGDGFEFDRRSPHFAVLGDELAVAAVDAQGNLQLDAAQRFDGGECGIDVEEGAAEAQRQTAYDGEAGPHDEFQQANQGGGFPG
ncbi:hypothetical protein D3C77_571270 [compost metagenome]